MRTCSKCKETKEDAEFKLSNQAKSGFSSHCRVCCKLYYQKRNQAPKDVFLQKHQAITANDKTCSKCKQKKPVAEFSKMLRTFDGYRPNCRECQKVDNRVKYLKRKAIVTN